MQHHFQYSGILRAGTALRDFPKKHPKLGLSQAIFVWFISAYCDMAHLNSHQSKLHVQRYSNWGQLETWCLGSCP